MEAGEARDRGSPAEGHPSGAALGLGDLITPTRACCKTAQQTKEKRKGETCIAHSPRGVSPENGFELVASSTGWRAFLGGRERNRKFYWDTHGSVMAKSLSLGDGWVSHAGLHPVPIHGS